MKEEIIVKEEDWDNSIYSTKEWYNNVTIINYEHDFIKKQYIIKFIKNESKTGT